MKIYQVKNESEKKIIIYFKSEGIKDIQFNPILDNIILVSFLKGHCKIYEIVKKNIIQEKILFEGINEKMINASKFSYLDTNIIASLCDWKTIIIWDVRKSKYINIIRNKEEKEKEEK